ncbi:MAG: M28 family peptidase, partial [Gemmatimonadales bacterium]
HPPSPMRRLLPLALFAIQPALAQSPGAVPAAMATIREADLKRDLYFLAADAMRGREAGTLDEMRASGWIAEQLRAIGVQPAGEDGTYFQWWNMRRSRLSAQSMIRLGDKTFKLWKDFAASATLEAEVSAQTVWAGDGSDSTIDVRGKVAVAQLVAPVNPGRSTTNSEEYRYARASLTGQGNALSRRGAVAVILVADETAEKAFDGVSAVSSRGTYDVDGRSTPRNGPVAPGGRGGRAGAGGGGRGAAGGAPPRPVPILLAHRAMLDALRANGQNVYLGLWVESFLAPSVNIVGKVPGTDAKLRDEYVLFSSHQDHDGVRYDINGDSTWSGADDNGSTSVALLAIARAFVKQPGRRSALFVYHGAEERGLLGSRYHSANPVVPLDKIVAVLNGDMIGRNHPDTASLMGVQPPHRNSSELVAMALRANSLTGKFVLDSIWDRPTHPEGWYFRSDHLPYARLNVPALEYSTNLHNDYHTPRDKPAAINYPKLTRMTQWMYLTGWFVANTDKRPAIDPGFQLER